MCNKLHSDSRPIPKEGSCKGRHDNTLRLDR